MENKEAKELLDKYRAGELTEQERVQLDSWYLQQARSNQSPVDNKVMQRNLDEIWDNISGEGKGRVVQLRVILAAAIMLLVFSAGFYFVVIKPGKSNSNYAHADTQKIVPGQNKAFLVLANGAKIDLTQASNGQLAKQAGLTVSKTKAGQLVYTVAAGSTKNTGDVNAYNTIETPRGGQYQVNLPDGTRVWLNAASSLKYPLKFDARERKVVLTGQGYFEVAHNPQKPFKVITNKQEVEVLGTHFDINAYTDEPEVETTLLQGSVRVALTGNSAGALVLRPGQQSALKNGRISVAPADTTAAVAWKNGYFKFNGDMAGILRQLARWYNVDIVYATGDDPDLQFGGEISRFKDINSILNIIEATGNVHFKTEGRRITVMR